MKNTKMQEAKSYMDTLKMEISTELGVSNIKTGANRTARENGRIGGQITKQLVELGKQQLNSMH